MNQRITELAAQTLGELAGQGWNMQTDPFNKFTDRFAEMLVKECSKVITDLPNRMVDAELSPYNEGWRNGRLLAKEHIEQHFGVEE